MEGPGRKERKDANPGARMVRMIRTLCSRGMTRAELEEEFQVSRRHIYDYLQAIEGLGYVFVDHEGGGERVWRIDGGYQGIKPEPATLPELMALHLAKSHLAYLNGTPFVESLEHLIQKVEAGLPTKVANHLKRVTQVFVPLQAPIRPYENQGPLLAQIQRALLLQRVVRLNHTAAGYDEPVEHRVDPYALLLYQYGLYLFGYSHRSKARRLFAVERIASVELTDDICDIPEDLSIERAYERLFGLIDEPVHTVRIWFSPEVAYLVKERRWHPTQHVEAQADGSVVATIEAGGLDELASWVLSWGADAKVLSPQALIVAVRSKLAAASRQYSS
ncbi:WYL domain-containing protein [Nitrospira tepida]|uniref:WYL domain-containing protein n=2 Tax=Nitrospira tepida TaxID=2973512 RepID=A0AA86T7X5_9BACT|nr:WYL domain-containing protein [Nitrospira tepida]